ncbi:MAG: hypothetical protein Kow0080_05180 [Candidatus Promineifilaceae bacterium]
MWNSDFVITKRLLGIGFVLLGIGAIAGMFVLDWLGAGQFQGIGPAQQKAMLAAGVSIFVGLTLIPLGDRPA